MRPTCVNNKCISFHFSFQKSLACLCGYDGLRYFYGSLFCAVGARFSCNNEVNLGLRNKYQEGS